jgi:DegV family protein with EDD domain
VAVQVIVDSTADLPAQRAQELGIRVVPLMVLFGDEAYRDGIDLAAAEFYTKLTTTQSMPTTSAPAPGIFEEAYRAAIAAGATGILEMSISSSLSATYSVAKQVGEQVASETGVPIEVIDSRQVSMGFGLPAEIVAAEAQRGASLADLKAHAESLLGRVRLYATLDTLEFLQRGGRIGRAQALLGTLLSMKPLLQVRDGEVLPLERVRTRGKAIERIGQLVQALGPLEALAIVGTDEESRRTLVEIVRGFWSGPVETSALGPVVGTHAGPGASGVVAITQS